MSDAVNCSYVDQNSVYHEDWCTGEAIHCCRSGWQLTCSINACEATNLITDVSSYIFWLILAGIAGFGIIVLSITYLVCKYRAPREDVCERENEGELFEETICEAKFRKMARRNKPEVSGIDSPDFFMRSENAKTAMTNQRTSIPVRPKDIHDRMLISPRERIDSPPSWTVSSGISPRSNQHERRTPRGIHLGLLPDVG